MEGGRFQTESKSSNSLKRSRSSGSSARSSSSSNKKKAGIKGYFQRVLEMKKQVPDLSSLKPVRQHRSTPSENQFLENPYEQRRLSGNSIKPPPQHLGFDIRNPDFDDQSHKAPMSTISAGQSTNFLGSNIKGLGLRGSQLSKNYNTSKKSQKLKKQLSQVSENSASNESKTTSKKSGKTAPDPSSNKTQQEQTGIQLSRTEIFFDTAFNDFVFKFRYLIILISFMAAAYAGYRATEVQGLTTMEQYFKKNHFLTKSFESVLNDYNDGD